MRLGSVLISWPTQNCVAATNPIPKVKNHVDPLSNRKSENPRRIRCAQCSDQGESPSLPQGRLFPTGSRNDDGRRPVRPSYRGGKMTGIDIFLLLAGTYAFAHFYTR